MCYNDCCYFNDYLIKLNNKSSVNNKNLKKIKRNKTIKNIIITQNYS